MYKLATQDGDLYFDSFDKANDIKKFLGSEIIPIH